MQKRRLALLTQPAFRGGGTASNPFCIDKASQLAALAIYVNAGNAAYKSAYYLQTENLDLSAYANWTMIGSAAGTPFSGKYDGNGKTISGLNMSYPTVVSGLFGHCTGLIKNLGIESTTTGISVLQGAALCGYLYANGRISNCYNKAAITGTGSGTNTCRASGLVAINAGSVSDCINAGNVNQTSTSSATRTTAGIVGVYTGAGVTIRCFNHGTITGTGTLKAVSGVEANVYNIYFDNQVSGATQTHANSTGVTTTNCQGANAQVNMPNLDWLESWKVVTNAYPALKVFG